MCVGEVNRSPVQEHEDNFIAGRRVPVRPKQVFKQVKNEESMCVCACASLNTTPSPRNLSSEFDLAGQARKPKAGCIDVLQIQHRAPAFSVALTL